MRREVQVRMVSGVPQCPHCHQPMVQKNEANELGTTKWQCPEWAPIEQYLEREVARVLAEQETP